MTKPSETNHTNNHQNEYDVASANSGDFWRHASRRGGKLWGPGSPECSAARAVDVNGLGQRGGTSRVDFLKHGQALMTVLLVVITV